jgi:hypothetical protein
MPGTNVGVEDNPDRHTLVMKKDQAEKGLFAMGHLRPLPKFPIAEKDRQCQKNEPGGKYHNSQCYILHHDESKILLMSRQKFIPSEQLELIIHSILQTQIKETENRRVRSLIKIDKKMNID